MPNPTFHSADNLVVKLFEKLIDSLNEIKVRSQVLHNYMSDYLLTHPLAKSRRQPVLLDQGTISPVVFDSYLTVENILERYDLTDLYLGKPYHQGYWMSLCLLVVYGPDLAKRHVLNPVVQMMAKYIPTIDKFCMPPGTVPNQNLYRSLGILARDLEFCGITRAQSYFLGFQDDLTLLYKCINIPLSIGEGRHVTLDKLAIHEYFLGINDDGIALRTFEAAHNLTNFSNYMVRSDGSTLTCNPIGYDDQLDLELNRKIDDCIKYGESELMTIIMKSTEKPELHEIKVMLDSLDDASQREDCFIDKFNFIYPQIRAALFRPIIKQTRHILFQNLFSSMQ